MEIGAVSNGLGLPAASASYETAKSAADYAKFSAVLDKVKREAENSEAAATGAATAASEEAKARAKLKSACQGFETMFLQMMYRQMRSTVPESSLFGKSQAMKIFEDMRDDELMKGVAEAGGVGLGDMLYKELSPQVLAPYQRKQGVAPC